MCSGFLEERIFLKAAGEKLGPAVLFYGVRNKCLIAHQDLLTNALNCGALSDLHVVVSEGQEGMMVHEKVLDQRRQVVNLLNQSSDSTFYACGGATHFGKAIREVYRLLSLDMNSRSLEECIKRRLYQEDLAD